MDERLHMTDYHIRVLGGEKSCEGIAYIGDGLFG
jgi:hypothetical protein